MVLPLAVKYLKKTERQETEGVIQAGYTVFGKTGMILDGSKNLQNL